MKGAKSLPESLKQFLQEETLCGSNQYMCGHCQKLSDAARRVLLHALPPLLIVQLKRFVFDEKVRSPVRAPAESSRVGSSSPLAPPASSDCAESDAVCDAPRESVRLRVRVSARRTTGRR